MSADPFNTFLSLSLLSVFRLGVHPAIYRTGLRENEIPSPAPDKRTGRKFPANRNHHPIIRKNHKDAGK
jgi:hypothetical protein